MPSATSRSRSARKFRSSGLYAPTCWEVVVRGIDAVGRERCSEAGEDPGLPVDERAVAVKGQHVHIAVIGVSRHGPIVGCRALLCILRARARDHPTRARRPKGGLWVTAGWIKVEGRRWRSSMPRINRQNGPRIVAIAISCLALAGMTLGSAFAARDQSRATTVTN